MSIIPSQPPERGHRIIKAGRGSEPRGHLSWFPHLTDELVTALRAQLPETSPGHRTFSLRAALLSFSLSSKTLYHLLPTVLILPTFTCLKTSHTHFSTIQKPKIIPYRQLNKLISPGWPSTYYSMLWPRPSFPDIPPVTSQSNSGVMLLTYYTTPFHS